MLKGWLIALGIGLGILWVCGLAGAYSSPGVSWTDFGAGVLSIAGAAGIRPRTSGMTAAAGTLLLSLGIFAIWLGAFFTPSPAWQVWWNFAFGCAYLLLGVAAVLTRARRVEVPEEEKEAA